MRAYRHNFQKHSSDPHYKVYFISGGYGFIIDANNIKSALMPNVIARDFDEKVMRRGGSEADILNLYENKIPNFAREAVRRYVGKKAKVVLPGETAPDGRKPPELPADYGVSVWIDLKDVDPSKPVPMFAAPRRFPVPPMSSEPMFAAPTRLRVVDLIRGHFGKRKVPVREIQEANRCVEEFQVHQPPEERGGRCG